MLDLQHAHEVAPAPAGARGARWLCKRLPVLLIAGVIASACAACNVDFVTENLRDTTDSRSWVDGANDVPPDHGGDAAVSEDTAMADVSDGAEVNPDVSLDAADSDDAPDGGDLEPYTPPTPRAPCPDPARCWTSPTFSSACGTSTLSEDFTSGRYNVHAFALSVRAGVSVELSLTRTTGVFQPAVLLHDSQGATVFDGELGAWGEGVDVQPILAGRTGVNASVRFVSRADQQLTVFLTGWHVVDSAFVAAMPSDAAYQFTVTHACTPPTGDLQTPPNFDPNNVDAGGYYLLPDSQPPGLYTRKPDACSRGTALLIRVLYTVALRWNALRPEYAPIEFGDLNEGSCSVVNHETHDDGTHADVVAGCATQAACTNMMPAVDLARLFIDTGEVCGIIFNDAAVQSVVNPYFQAQHTYDPWKSGDFMRTVGDHTAYMHIRVKKPDGTCNP